MVDISEDRNIHIRGIRGKIEEGQIICENTKRNISVAFSQLLERIRHSEE